MLTVGKRKAWFFVSGRLPDRKPQAMVARRPTHNGVRPAMRAPRIEYDLEIEIDDVVKVSYGNFTNWFLCTGDADRLVAFELLDCERVCVEADGTWTDSELRIYEGWRGLRLARRLPKDAFEAEWAQASNPYLFPTHRWQVTLEMPLGPDTPLDILADWLQDHGLDRAAQILRLNAESQLKSEHATPSE